MDSSETILVADAHCDTVTKLPPWRLAFGDINSCKKSHLDFLRLCGDSGADGSYKVCLQFMAFFLRQAEPDEAWRLLRQYWRDLLFAVAISGETILLQDLTRAGQSGKPELLAAVEGLDLLARDWHEVEQLYEMGFRSLGLFWNNDNFLGCGANAVGAADSGLTSVGREFIAYVERRGFLVDLAHASEKSFWQAAEICSKPLFVSHACCRALCEHRRNLTDEQLRALGESGGLVGITLAPNFLCEDGKAELADVVRHIAHAVELAGDEHVALGSDFDGVESLPVGIDGAESWLNLARALGQSGFSERQIRQIMGENLPAFIRRYAQ
jgi:membrane dipeptidase